VTQADFLYRHTDGVLADPAAGFPRIAAPTPVASQPSVVIATINRPNGDTGVHTHTAILHHGLADIGVRSRIVTPFGGSAKWLAVFAFRKFVLNQVNKTWSTRWYRHWYARALVEQLLQYLRDPQVGQVIAQCPVSAAAAMAARQQLGRQSSLKINLVCHFNHSEAIEYRNRGELNTARAYEAAMAFETKVLSNVDRIIYVSNWARDLVEKDRGVSARASLVIPNGIDALAPAPTLKRADIGLTDEHKVLINVGTLERRNL
jgi:hypothetical protein